MAGETIKTRATCLAIHPWSRTSHVVSWLTDAGLITTVVKGAVRPKSAFLGQYDLNYTCEILYYARAKGELHALRECTALERRDGLRGNFRALALADWFRRLAHDLAPSGPDAAEWLNLLEAHLDGLEQIAVHLQPSTSNLPPPTATLISHILDYELAVLRLSGLSLELEERDGMLHLRGEREIPVSTEVAVCLKNPRHEKDVRVLNDAARVVGVYYALHLDCAPEVRRTVLRLMISG